MTAGGLMRRCGWLPAPRLNPSLRGANGDAAIQFGGMQHHDGSNQQTASAEYAPLAILAETP
jgi:hypothetical protein